MKLIRFFAIIFLSSVICHLSSPTATAADYYVSPSGSDTNPGTLAQPLATIQLGIDRAVAGDHIKVMPGTYIQAGDYPYGQVGQFINRHGTSDSPIYLEAANQLVKPVIRGFSGIRVVASSYIHITGFSIQDFSHSGVPVYLSDHITLADNDFILRFDHTCTLEEGSAGLCSYYSTLGIGDIVGRVDKNGAPIKEHDGSQNTGAYFCKSTDNVITGNYFANLDESIYIGKAGNVSSDPCWSDGYALPDRLYNEQYTVSNNYFDNSWNEAIELKPDTRFNLITGNVIKSTRPAIESSQIEIRGHDNEITENVVLGAPNIGIRVVSETVADPGPDRVEAYKKADGSYMSSYRNRVHHNYVYEWSQYKVNGLGIDFSNSSAANTASHNTLVGSNPATGAVSEYASLKTLATPETVITDNLMVGVRRYDSTPGSTKYESHLTAYTNLTPAISDFNAYYPRFKTNNVTCHTTLGNFGINCQTANAHNLDVGFEGHSQFIEANPINSDHPSCAIAQLLNLTLADLRDRIHFCATPLPDSAVIGTASDGTNIGAWQTPASPTPDPFDFNADGNVDFLDLSYFLPNFTTIFDYNHLIRLLQP